MEIVVDASGLAADLAAIDLLARLRLVGAVRLSGASEELRDLIGLCGLADALGVEPRRQSEEREEPAGVQEEGELGDPPV